mgnify:CR=1 FL=1
MMGMLVLQLGLVPDIDLPHQERCQHSRKHNRRQSRIDEMSYEGLPALSINAFMYRERGVLIAYPLCGRCAEKLVAQRPTEPTSMHKDIERNLVDAYLAYLDSLT